MEWYTTNSGKYRIESLSAATLPGSLELIRHEFCKEEPFCIASEVNINPRAIDEMLEFCANVALDGVSLVAVTTDTGEVAAVIFNKLKVPTTNSKEKTFYEVFAEERCTQASSRSFLQSMIDTDEKCNLFEIYGVDCGLELMFLATHRKHRFKKLGSLLCEYSIELAKSLKNGPVSTMTIKDLGPKFLNMQPRDIVKTSPKICIGCWTGAGTQKIFKRLGFTKHLTMGHEEFVYMGTSNAEKLGDNSLYCEVGAKVVE